MSDSRYKKTASATYEVLMATLASGDEVEQGQTSNNPL